MADIVICPECAAGKCRNCDGTTWDDTTDAPTTCPCTHSVPIGVAAATCRVYWGTHGCGLLRGHDPAVTPHECVTCCDCGDHAVDHEAAGCVALPPYYGPETWFYGEDAPATTTEGGTRG